MSSSFILLVEDNPDDVELALRSLRRENRVVVVRDGAEALDFLQGDENPAQMPSVILLDLNLPKIGGLEVLRRLRADQRTRDLPVLILSASEEKRDIAESQDLGADGFLSKPFNPSDFKEALRRLGLHRLSP